MRILLPPSEAKQTGGRRGLHPIAFHSDSSPLASARAVVAAALIDFCHADPGGATRTLALPARSADADLESNRELLAAPTARALDRYAGTVYEGLAAATLPAVARRRALASVLIFSGLFGVLRADERIPAYRLPVAATLPPIGPLTAYWRDPLRTEMATLLDDDLIVDLRSSDYSAMWRPAGSTRDRVVVIRIMSEQPDGRLAVISYPSKHGKGRLARALLSHRGRLTATAQIAQLWTAAGGRDAIDRGGNALDLVT